MDDQTDRRSYGALRNEEIISALHSSQDFFGLFDTHNEMLTTVKLTNTSSQLPLWWKPRISILLACFQHPTQHY